MSGKGFAIQCPRCQRWNVWDTNPDEVAIDSTEELEQILTSLYTATRRGESEMFSHKKLLRCNSPRWFCPASFEAFICRTRQEATAFLNVAKPWSFKREFRLYKSDCQSRWTEKYYGILFCTTPVVPQRNIGLEQLMSQEILSQLVLGIGTEIELPLTFYAAKVFEPEDGSARLFWMPIEAYSKEKLLVPPRYNVLRFAVRQILMKKLYEEFENNRYNAYNCPIGFGRNGKCAGQEAPCMRLLKEWNCCPAFIAERQEEEPQSYSDLKLIEKVNQNWRQGKLPQEGLWQVSADGFTDIAFPISVHDELVGIAITGQVFTNTKEITEVSDYLCHDPMRIANNKVWNLLGHHKRELEVARQVLIQQELQLRKEGKSGRFLFARQELDKRIKSLVINIQRITEMATTRYREIRERSETAFREELLGLVQNWVTHPVSFEKTLLRILRRMQDFWRFKAAIFLSYSMNTKNLCLIAFCSENHEIAFDFPGRKIGQIETEWPQTHPYTWLYDRLKKQSPMHPWVQKFAKILEDIGTGGEINLPEGRCYFNVAVPFAEHVYGFVFAVRDETKTGLLPTKNEWSVSALCQEFMFKNCTEVIHQLVGMKSIFEEQKRREKILGRLTHELKVPLVAIRGAVEFMKQTPVANKLSHEEYLEDIWSWTDLMGRLVDNADVIRYSTDGMQLKLCKTYILEDAIIPALRQARLLLREHGFSPENIKYSREKFIRFPALLLDRGQFQQVMFNLLSNAVKYAYKDPNAFHVEIDGDEKELKICFRDWGPGIESGTEEEIFKEGFRGKAAIRNHVTGQGLGLWVVRQIVEKHGGRVDITNLRCPTEFSIFLPHSLSQRTEEKTRERKL